MQTIKFIVLMMLALTPITNVLAQNDDAFKRCSACHLASGKGIPSAFPPVNDRLIKVMSHAPGRDYLVMTLEAGLMGPITVDNMTFRGVMPAQGNAIKPEGIAAALNYIATELSTADASFKPFTSEEVTEIISRYPQYNSQKVYTLRAAAYAFEEN